LLSGTGQADSENQPCYHRRVSGAKLFTLVAVFFFTSVISVVTGSTSLITVPVMIALGIEAHVAVATNMLALTVMSVGDSLPFMGKGVLTRPLAVGLVALLALLNTYLVSKRLELRRLREQLISSTIQQELVRQQSFTDPLTEIYNRRSLEDIAGRFISHARRLSNSLSLLLIDVDRFKDVNTTFGHLTGDVVLADTAALLKSSVRGSDAVFRYGGDEFLIILADTSRSGATKVVERIRAYLLDWNRAATLDGFELSLSIGVSEWSDGVTLNELLDEADREMYAAKANHTLDKAQPSLVRAAARKIGL
jgi:diguanylate cyclase (GGDEF)-like protein